MITSLAQAVATTEPPLTLVVALLAAVTALAGTVVFLFRHYAKKVDTHDEVRKKMQEEIAQERLSWAAERGRFEALRNDFEESREKFEREVRAQYEERLRVTSERYAESERQNVAQARREFAELMESVAQQAEIQRDKYAAVFEKFLDRFALSRGRPKG
jgi:hypothetical protein